MKTKTKLLLFLFILLSSGCDRLEKLANPETFVQREHAACVEAANDEERTILLAQRTPADGKITLASIDKILFNRDRYINGCMEKKNFKRKHASLAPYTNTQLSSMSVSQIEELKKTDDANAANNPSEWLN